MKVISRKAYDSFVRTREPWKKAFSLELGEYCYHDGEEIFTHSSAEAVSVNIEEEPENSVHLSPTGSKRDNKGKPEFSQLDPQFLLDLAALMTHSAQKYEKYNWARGQLYCTPLDSMARHLFKVIAGEDKDQESGFNHLLHIAANAMILYRSMIVNKQSNVELDDRSELLRLEDDNGLRVLKGDE